MNQLQTSFVGLIDFAAKLVVVLYLLRLLAIKFHAYGPGQGLAALVF